MNATELADYCSNEGRWGPEDELGTLNYIDADVRLRALALVRSGTVVSVGRDLAAGSTMQHMMLSHSFKSDEVIDYVGIACHGWDITHLDAVGHILWHGETYNGRGPEIVARERLTEGSVYAYRGGIASRGVLLDLPRALGVHALDPGHYVSVDDLERAEHHHSVEVGTGDVLYLRTGKAVDGRERKRATPEEPWPGLGPDCLAWLHDRQVAVFSGDCVERLPGNDPELPMPLHLIGICRMGLCLLDWSDVEPLAAECAKQGRWEFFTVASPLRMPGVTGSAVNPLCFF